MSVYYNFYKNSNLKYYIAIKKFDFLLKEITSKEYWDILKQQEVMGIMANNKGYQEFFHYIFILNY